MRLPGRSASLIAIATALSLLGDQLLYSVLPTCYEELGLRPIHLAVLLSANRWIRLLTNHLAERLCRRYSPTVLVTVSLAVGAGITAIYGAVDLFVILVLARVLWGLCWSFIRQVGVMTTVDAAPAGHVSEAMGYYNGISRMGSLAGNFLGALLHDLIGFSGALLRFAAVSLLAVPLGALSQRGVDYSGARAAEADRDAAAGNARRGSRLLLVCGAVLGCCGGLVMSTAGRFLKSSFGDETTVLGLVVPVATLTGALLGLRWIADTVGAPILGALTDRFGRRRTSVALFAAGGVALLAASQAQSLAALFLLVVAFYLCATTLTTAAVAEAGRRGSRPFAGYVTAYDTGSALGPTVGWTILSLWLLPPVVFVMGAVLYGAAAVLSVRAFGEREVT